MAEGERAPAGAGESIGFRACVMIGRVAVVELHELGATRPRKGNVPPAKQRNRDRTEYGSPRLDGGQRAE
jgi:hypothetical protein